MPARKRRFARHDSDAQLELARAVQHSLLPAPLASTARFEFATGFAPAQVVAGDFYDYFQPQPDLVGFYLGDVQGKGLEGAMYAALVSGIMRGLQKSGTPPARLLELLNHRLCLRPIPNKFCVLAYALLDLAQSTLTYASAGMPFPLLLRGGTTTRIELPGFPLGLFADASYEQQEVRLQPGDFVLSFSDGLPESFESRRVPDGDAVLRRLLAGASAGTAQHLAHYLLRRLASAQRHRPLADDTTFLVLRIL